MMPLGDMAPQAKRQLAAWEAIAKDWQLTYDRTTVMRCPDCGRGVYLVTDKDGNPYKYIPSAILALVVLHLRNHHADLDPN